MKAKSGQYLQSVIHSRMNINVALFADIAGATTRILLMIPPDVLLMVGQCHIEIKSFIPLRETQPYKGVLTPTILDLQNEVSRRVKNGLDGVLPLTRVNKTSSEEFAGVGIFQPDLTSVLAGHNPKAAGPDLIGLQPLAALVAAGCGSRRDFVDGNLTNDKESVLEGLLVLLKRHREL